MKILIPAISQERIVTCLRTLRTNPKDIIVVDNSPNGLELPFSVGRRVHRGMNLGVAHSWNIGVRALMESDDTHLAICSQSVVFGRNGGRELKEMLGDEWGAEYVGLGWHLNMFTRKFFEAFGFFDENFHPAYMEDTDALYRMGLLTCRRHERTEGPDPTTPSTPRAPMPVPSRTERQQLTSLNLKPTTPSSGAGFKGKRSLNDRSIIQSYQSTGGHE